jgi:hypothetical protein
MMADGPMDPCALEIVLVLITKLTGSLRQSQATVHANKGGNDEGISGWSGEK